MSTKANSKKTSNSSPNIALVHDYLREYGGAERVLEALHQLYPTAPVYVGFIDERAMGRHWTKFSSWQLHQTWLASIPFIKQLYSPLRVFAPKAFAELDLSRFDIVISSSNAYFAKAVSVPNGTHICYCHTPPRALYGYTTRSNWRENPVLRVFGELLNHYLRVVDFQIAQRVDLFIANSVETKARIKKFYRRNSVIINPPIVVPKKTPKLNLVERQYYLYVNRLALAKHPELAVAACTALQLPLKLVGSGPMVAELQKIAGPTVEFLGAVSDTELSQLYEGARALLYPVEDEDFGMIPVEAMAHGVPVLAHRSGGPVETVVEGKTGFFFDELTEAALTAVIKKYEKNVSQFHPSSIYKHAQGYAHEQFFQKMSSVIQNILAN